LDAPFFEGPTNPILDEFEEFLVECYRPTFPARADDRLVQAEGRGYLLDGVGD
jgi:hypothetical protein